MNIQLISIYTSSYCNSSNIPITWGKDLTGFIKTSYFTRVSLKNLSGLPEILRRY